MKDDALLGYEDVIAYLEDRDGEEVFVGSHPTFTGGPGKATGLGLNLRARIGGVRVLPQHQCDAFLDGQSGVQVLLVTDKGEQPSLGLVVTREWFRTATLSPDRSLLRIVVRADLGATPSDPLVGWGFTFDFDGSAPSKGRWALQEGKS